MSPGLMQFHLYLWHVRVMVLWSPGGESRAVVCWWWIVYRLESKQMQFIKRSPSLNNPSRSNTLPPTALFSSLHYAIWLDFLWIRSPIVPNGFRRTASAGVSTLDGWPNRHHAPTVSIDPDSYFERYRVIPSSFRDTKATVLTQPACFWAHTDEASTSLPALFRAHGKRRSPGAAARHSQSARAQDFLNKFFFFSKTWNRTSHEMDMSWDVRFHLRFHVLFYFPCHVRFSSPVLCSICLVLSESFWFVFLFRFEWLKKLTCPVLKKKTSCPVVIYKWRIPQKVKFKICLGGNGTYRIAEKVTLKIIVRGNGTRPHFRKSEFPNLFGGKWNVSGFLKKWISKPDLEEIGSVRIWEKWMSTSVGVEMGHVRNPQKVNLQMCLGGN